MNKQDGVALLKSLKPDFFEREYIRNIPGESIYDEMVLLLDEFNPKLYEKQLADNISFGYYEGDIETLRKVVEQVDLSWVNFYTEESRAYCGYIDGRVVSFCLVEDMGTHEIGGKSLKIGGPGCVGTLPECRNKGIGLMMIRDVTQILKDEGYDYSYIHYTGVAPWYARLGYRTSVRWNNKGII